MGRKAKWTMTEFLELKKAFSESGKNLSAFCRDSGYPYGVFYSYLQKAKVQGK